MHQETLCLLFASLVAACVERPDHRTSEAVGGSEPLIATPDCFELYHDLFDMDSVVVKGLGTCALDTRTLGPINITSNRMAIGDPVVIQDILPYAFVVPNGTHPVDIVRVYHGGYKLNALLRIRLSDDGPISWKFASNNKATMDNTNVRSERFIGFGVDAASALAFDPVNQQMLSKGKFDLLWTDSVKVRDHFVAFSTNGDGFFPVYVGFNDKGEPTQVIVDLLMVECTCEQ